MKQLLIILFTFFLATATGIHAQDSKKDSKKEIKESLIRTGNIDLKKIDKNKDGKVFECPMDWNIIDDQAGRCPECKMKLKEYSLEDAKKNLLKHGHKVKQ